MSENTQKNPAYKGKNAWKVYGDSNRLGDVYAFVDGYIDFLNHCKTERETVAFCEKTLRAHGFGDDPKGKRYLKTLRGKCLFAFRKGTEPMSSGISRRLPEA